MKELRTKSIRDQPLNHQKYREIERGHTTVDQAEGMTSTSRHREGDTEMEPRI